MSRGPAERWPLQNVLSAMQEALRQAIIGDDASVAGMYLASRRRILSHAPLAHTDEAVRTRIRSQLNPAGGVTVALSEEIILGFLAVSSDTRYGWIEHLYLDPSAVGVSLGTILLDQAKLSLGARIRLYTFQENVDARRFYRLHGFREIELSDGGLNEEKAPDVLLEWA